MKRTKIMLTAIAVLAGVGGALAFKANNMRAQKYCISKTGWTCTVTVISKQGGVIQITATTFPVGVTRCTLANGGVGSTCHQKLNLVVE